MNRNKQIGVFNVVYITHEINIPLTSVNLLKVAKLNRDFADNYSQSSKDSEIMMTFDFHRKRCYQSITIFLHMNLSKEYQSISICYYTSFHSTL